MSHSYPASCASCAAIRSGWGGCGQKVYVKDERGQPLRRTLGLAVLGGATLDSEENYLIKKLFTAAGAVSIENQARI